MGSTCAVCLFCQSTFVCQSVCFPACTCACMPVSLFILPSLTLSLCLSVCLFVLLFVCFLVDPCVIDCLSVYLSISLSVRPSTCLYACPSFRLTIAPLRCSRLLWKHLLILEPDQDTVEFPDEVMTATEIAWNRNSHDMYHLSDGIGCHWCQCTYNLGWAPKKCELVLYNS